MANNSASRNSRRYFLTAGYATLIAAFAVFAVWPYARGMSEAHADISRLQQEIAARQDRTHQLDVIQRRLQMVELQTRNYDRLVPASQDVGSFLAELTQELAKAGMRDTSYSELQATPLGKSVRQPIEVHGRGTFAQLHEFLVRLENLQRMSSVGKLTIEADNDMSGNVTAQLTLFIYNTNTKPGS